jgi:hypothetical protein
VPKRIRREDRQSIGEEVQVQVFANILQALEVEFAEKEGLSHRQEWCEPVPHERRSRPFRTSTRRSMT